MKETTPKDTRTVENTVNDTANDTARVKNNAEDELKKALQEEEKTNPFLLEPRQDALGYRPHLNVMMAPGIPFFLQDAVETSPRGLFNLICDNDDVHSYFDRIADKRISYSGQPEDYPLPYYFPSAIHFKMYQWVVPQSYFYVLRIDVDSHELAPGEAYIVDRSGAERVRDLLSDIFIKKVRVAYVAPSQDAVYLICQGEMKGGYGLQYVKNTIEAEQETMKWDIRRVYEPNGRFREISIKACKWAYLAHDPGVRWNARFNRE
jgi:hypothetical protein